MHSQVSVGRISKTPILNRFLLHAYPNSHRDDLEAARHDLQQLQPVRSFGDLEVIFEINLLEIDLLLKQQEYQKALNTVNKHITAMKHNAGAGM